MKRATIVLSFLLPALVSCGCSRPPQPVASPAKPAPMAQPALVPGLPVRQRPLEKQNSTFPVAWTAVPDAGPPGVAITAAFPVPVPRGSDVQFPRAWPPLALLTQAKRVEGVDLRTGQIIGSVQSPEPFPGQLVLSSDGKLLAARMLKPGDDHLRFWSFATGRVAGDRIVSKPDQRFGPITQLLFAGNERLIGIRPGVGGGQVVVCDLAGAPQPRTFLLASAGKQASLVGNALGTSPTGKYLAALVGTALVVHEVETGRCVGTSELPGGMVDAFSICKELVFSPDGQRIATLILKQSESSLLLLEWDAATGKLTTEKRWNAQSWVRESNLVLTSDEHPLAPLPDGSGWVLFGSLRWLRSADAPEVAFPRKDDPHLRLLLDGDRVVAKVRNEQGDLTLQTMVRAGATLANRPAAAPPSSAANAWKAQADAAAVPQIAPQAIAVFGNVPRPLRFSQRPSRFAACAIAGEYVVFDLAAGKEWRRFKPAGGQPLPIWDVAPDGESIVVAEPQTEQTWKFAVLETASGSATVSGSEAIGRGDQSIEFLSPALLLFSHTTDSGARRSVVWNCEQKQSAQEFTTARPGSYLQSQLVTPGGKYLACMFQEAVVVHEIASGAFSGQIPLPPTAGRTLPQKVLAAAISIDGSQLCLVVEYGPGTINLFACDLVHGQLASSALDATQLAALAGERISTYPAPWLLPESGWLFYRQVAIQVPNGELIGPLGLRAEASVLPLANNKVLLGQIESKLTPSPAVAVTPLPIQANVAASLASTVEALRPKAVVVAPVPKPVIATIPMPVPAREQIEPAQPSWTAMADAPVAKPITPAAKFEVPIAVNSRFAAAVGGEALLVVDEQAEQAQVLNLGSGRMSGKPFAFPRRTEQAAIDPAGAYAAVSNDNEISIVHVESGKTATVQREGSFVKCRFLGFAAGQQLVAAFEADGQTEILCWEPTGGKPVKKFVLSSGNEDWGVRNTGLAISPGGRYLAALRHDGLSLYDLQGKGISQTASVPFANTRGQTIIFHCDGIAFSPDGQRLAATYKQGQHAYATIWDLTSGEAAVFRPSKRPIHLRTITESDYGPRLAWFADGETLLYAGAILLDAATGCPYWVVDQSDRDSVLPLGPAMLLEVENGPQRRLVATSLPPQVAAARKAVRASPAVTMPPLKKADPAVAQFITDARAAPASADALAGPLSSGPVRFTSSKQDERPARLAISPAGVLVVEQALDYLQLSRPVTTVGPLTPERDVALETYDIAGNKRLYRIAVPERSQLLDVSPDGSLLLTGDELFGSGGYSRFDIWSPALGVQAAGWEPLPRSTDFFSVATWAQFVDKRQVLVHGNGTLTLWKLPECKQVYSLVTRVPPRLSANRKYFIDLEKGVLRDAFTGGQAGQLAGVPSAEHLHLVNALFSADGERVVGITTAGPSHSLVEWDAVRGTLTKQFAIPLAPVSRIAAVGERGLLLLAQPEMAAHGGILADLRQQQLISQLKSNGIHTTAPDGSYWRSDVLIEGGQPTNVARGFDVADFTWPAAGSTAPYAVLRPGSSVSVDFQSNLPNAAQLRSSLEARLKAAGLVLDSAAAVKVVCAANADKTIVQRAPIEVSIPVIACRLAVVDVEGKTAWESQERGRHDMSVQFDVEKWIASRPLPRVLFKPDWRAHLKMTDFPAVQQK